MTTRPKRLIQVPIDDELLTRVDTGASVVRESRAEFVRQACEQRLKKLEDLAKDQQYEAGYARIPEDEDRAKASAKALAALMPPEKW